MPEVEVQSRSGPKDFTLRRGIEGHLGNQGLLIVRPRFGLAITCETLGTLYDQTKILGRLTEGL